MQYNITYREKDNSWQYIISYKDTNSEWKQKSKQGFELSRKGKQFCKESAEKMVEKLKLSLNLIDESKDMTFSEYKKIFIEHLELYKEQNTIKLYKVALKNFESLNTHIMNEIKIKDIQEQIDILVRRGLKPTTINEYIAELSSVFYSAIKNGIIIENPVKEISHLKIKEKTEKTALTKKELELLLSKIKNRKLYIASLLAGKCGLRAGEILGLTWDNIDFENKQIIVEKQLKRNSKNIYKFGILKSPNSYRKVPIPNIVLKELEKFKVEYTFKDNRVLKYTSVSLCTNAKKCYKELEYDISIHELRHTYATLLISQGMDFKSTANLLGHDIKQTMNTYSHVTDEMKNNAAKMINNIFDE